MTLIIIKVMHYLINYHKRFKMILDVFENVFIKMFLEYKMAKILQKVF